VLYKIAQKPLFSSPKDEAGGSNPFKRAKKPTSTGFVGFSHTVIKIEIGKILNCIIYSIQCMFAKKNRTIFRKFAKKNSNLLMGEKSGN